MQHPLVSVAIITYNQKIYLKECIESILSQDYQNIEIVIADDCSTDGTQELLRDYAKEHPEKFILKLSKENKGITANSNEAHFACQGKYIAWIGGDDLMLAGKISKQVDFMEKNPACTISYHNLDVFDSDTGNTIYYFNSERKFNGDVHTAIRHGTFNGACSNLVRAEMTPEYGFNTSLPASSDWMYWVDSLANGGTIDYIDEVLGRYRRHENNITKKEKYITQVDIDRLNSCNIMLAKYPQYTEDVFFSYSRNFRALRHKLDYAKCLCLSFSMSQNLKSLAGLAVYLVSLFKVKL